MNRQLLAIVVIAAVMATAPAVATPAQRTAMSMRIDSPAFADRGDIPSQYTCEGSDVSPPLQWSGAPAGTRSLVLIVDDPDAPDPKAPKMTWVHWLLYDLPADSTGLAEAVTPDALPKGTRAGMTDFKRTTWGGPCPPIGKHRYFFKLYALDTALPDLGQPNKKKLEAAMQGHIIGQTEMVGLYQKRK